MKFHLITPHTLEFSVIQKWPVPQWLDKLINGEDIVDEEFPLKLDLRNILYRRNQKYGWKVKPFADAIIWGNKPEGTVTLNKGSFMVISPKLKAILTQFKLPPDIRFYPIELTLTVTKETKPYFLMVSHRMNMREIWCKKCCYEEIRTYFEYTKNITPHTYFDKDNFERKDRLDVFGENNTMNFKEMIGFNRKKSNPKTPYISDLGEHRMAIKQRRPIRKVFKVDYDVLWGSPNNFIISQAIKDACDAAGLYGVNFYEEQPEYVLYTEYQERRKAGNLHIIDCPRGYYELPKEAVGLDDDDETSRYIDVNNP